MKLKNLPSIIEKNNFNEKGLVIVEQGFLVPVYVGSQQGFSSAEKNYLENNFYPELKKRGVLPLCPFTACAEYLNLSELNDNTNLKEYTEFWERFNEIIGPVNYEILMPHSKFMIAIFDGGHACDDGLSAEVSYYASNFGSVIGIRSDFRLSENIAAPINPAIRYFLDKGPYKGKLFTGTTAYEDALNEIEKLANEIKNY